MDAHPDLSPEAEEAARATRALWDEHAERLRAARQQVRNHPAAHLFAQAETLRQSIDSIFMPNYVTLRSVLIGPTRDVGLAIELTQNVRRSPVAETHSALLVRDLHNYLAGSYTLVEHVRTLMARQPDELKERWYDERKRHFGSDEMRFVGDLRRYIQHYAHLPVMRRISFTGAAVQVQSMNFTSGLVAATLLKWEGWTRPARAYLERQDVIDMLPLFDAHASAAVAANRWLLSQLVAMITPMVHDYNELVARANSVLTGLDLEDAKRFTEIRTRQRNSTEEPQSPA